MVWGLSSGDGVGLVCGVGLGESSVMEWILWGGEISTRRRVRRW